MAHYVAGVLDHESMSAAIDQLCQAASYAPDDRVKTARGTTRGVIIRMLPDGRLVWRPDNSTSELTALPETLLKE